MPVQLLAITPPAGPVDPGLARAWLRAGVAREGFAILLREPGCPPDQLLAAGGRLAPLRRACADAGLRVLLSCDGHALAAACALLPRAPALAGLQLRGDPSADTLRAARSRLGPQSLLGRSCHGAPRPAAEHGLVDYTCFAPVFSPTTRQAGVDKRAAGIEALRAWTRADGAHVLALGGVTPSTAAACVTAGARGLAGIGVFFGDPGRVVEDVHALRVALPRP